MLEDHSDKQTQVLVASTSSACLTCMTGWSVSVWTKVITSKERVDF